MFASSSIKLQSVCREAALEEMDALIVNVEELDEQLTTKNVELL